jgi:hypothetical protein
LRRPCNAPNPVLHAARSLTRTSLIAVEFLLLVRSTTAAARPGIGWMAAQQRVPSHALPAGRLRIGRRGLDRPRRCNQRDDRTSLMLDPTGKPTPRLRAHFAARGTGGSNSHASRTWSSGSKSASALTRLPSRSNAYSRRWTHSKWRAGGNAVVPAGGASCPPSLASVQALDSVALRAVLGWTVGPGWSARLRRQRSFFPTLEARCQLAAGECGPLGRFLSARRFPNSSVHSLHGGFDPLSRRISGT